MSNQDAAPIAGERAESAAPQCVQLDERALSALEQAAETVEFDTDLLKTTPARDMRRKIEELVVMLKATDHSEFLKKQGLFASFTGADIEARLRFELASQDVISKMGELRRAAQNGRHVCQLLQQAGVELQHEQDRIEQVIQDAKRLLSRTADADDYVRSRFERRLSNLMAVNVANTSTIKQIELAVQVLKTLLDRCLDVDTALFPLWQRNVLALAQAAPPDRQQAARRLIESKSDLMNYLQQD